MKKKRRTVHTCKMQFSLFCFLRNVSNPTVLTSIVTFCIKAFESAFVVLWMLFSDSATLPLNYLLTVISSEHTPGRWTLVFHLVTQFSSVVVFLFFSFSAHPSPLLLTTSSCDSFILRLRGKVGGGGCCTVLQSWMGSLSLPCVLHNVQSCQNALPTKPLLIHRLFHVQLTVCTLKKNYIFLFLTGQISRLFLHV